MIEKSCVYDHKRHFAAKQRNEQVREKKYVWNFVLERDDGTLVSLHPNFSYTKVSCQFGGWCSDDGERPKSGKGGTSGKGTYRYFINKHEDVTLRFGARKNGKGTPQSRCSEEWLGNCTEFGAHVDIQTYRSRGFNR